MNEFVGKILQIKFYPCCYILICQVHALNAEAHLSAVLLCYFRCSWWCRNLAVINCILHWI